MTENRSKHVNKFRLDIESVAMTINFRMGILKKNNGAKAAYLPILLNVIMAKIRISMRRVFYSYSKVVVITEDVQNVHLLLEYRPHIDVSLTCEHDPKLQEYCVCPQNMSQFDYEGIPNQAPETNKPMILNGPKVEIERIQISLCTERESHAAVQRANTVVRTEHFRLLLMSDKLRGLVSTSRNNNIEKAFDKVWHEGLLFKLKPIVSDTLFRILQSYLCNRIFSVKYENVVSQVRSIQTGVPQGSVLGPYLYLIYVSDFPRDANLTTAQFADDVAVLCKDSCEMAANKLQQFLHLVDICCNKWKVKMNPRKSNVIQFTYKRKTENQSITLQGEEVSHAESVRYLGLYLDRKLTWNTHISNLVKRLRHKLYQVKHLLKGSSPLPLHLKRHIFLIDQTYMDVWL
ncbi:hypothetical protein ANN_20167 [Periplaneta americana]|uniref:Reverse transcriptase domain-containing protein n=1 Tax=Periplaneta americana TaxID=6978 RepID=A0ABQ8SC48_PERAM|nr:hypothetical protein ANN_20167 [Periplaneta americana]